MTETTLSFEDLKADPFLQFTAWFEDAKKRAIEPEAMALATATKEGHPSCRMVLLKGFDTRGFLFFTNSESRKGKEIAQNPKAAVTFYWSELERQIVAEGTVSLIPNEETNHYFESRPRLSQLGAWASLQDEVIPSRNALIERLDQASKKYEGSSIPRPPYWNGYRLLPTYFEFWQGREGRLHDRFRYILKDKWIIERLSP